MNAHPKRVKRSGSRFGAPTNPNSKDKLAREAREAKRRAAKEAKRGEAMFNVWAEGLIQD